MTGRDFPSGDECVMASLAVTEWVGGMQDPPIDRISERGDTPAGPDFTAGPKRLMVREGNSL